MYVNNYVIYLLIPELQTHPRDHVERLQLRHPGLAGGWPLTWLLSLPNPKFYPQKLPSWPSMIRLPCPPRDTNQKSSNPKRKWGKWSLKWCPIRRRLRVKNWLNRSVQCDHVDNYFGDEFISSTFISNVEADIKFSRWRWILRFSGSWGSQITLPFSRNACKEAWLDCTDCSENWHSYCPVTHLGAFLKARTRL